MDARISPGMTTGFVCEVTRVVIASEAKQSNFAQRKLDCFVAYAPRNDGFSYIL
jgi:hypothetical protein